MPEALEINGEDQDMEGKALVLLASGTTSPTKACPRSNKIIAVIDSLPI